MTGTALRFVAPRRVELGPVAVPEPADGQLLVRTEFSGISGGTEMLAYRGEIDPALPLDETLDALGGTFTYPFAYGYRALGPRAPPRRGLRAAVAAAARGAGHARVPVRARAGGIRGGGRRRPRPDPRGAAVRPVRPAGRRAAIDALGGYPPAARRASSASS